MIAAIRFAAVSVPLGLAAAVFLMGTGEMERSLRFNVGFTLLVYLVAQVLAVFFASLAIEDHRDTVAWHEEWHRSQKCGRR